ncbi:MAG: DNA translocase FtsK 4TM domain-containing protein [Bacteroidota bacterium]|nr:DNA translocase FtsK 4TM domain-containing protein [Bacteroidota bacterium]
MPAPRGNYKRNSDAKKPARTAKKRQSRRGGSRTQTARSRAPKADSDGPRRRGRTQEVLGVLLIALSVLIGIACVTYIPEDSQHIARDGACSGFRALIMPSPYCIVNVQNAGGPLGAWIADGIVRNSFGYTTLLLVLLLIAFGYRILRKRSLASLVKPALVLLASTAYTSVLIGRLDQSLDVSLALFSGNWGAVGAGGLAGMTGWLGSYFILAVVLLVGMLLISDGDLQRSLDRVERLFVHLRSIANQGREAAVRTLETAMVKDQTNEQLSWDDLDESGDGSNAPKVEPVPTAPQPVSKSANDTAAPSVPSDPGADVQLSVVGQVTEAKAHSLKPRKSDGYKYPSIDLLDKAPASGQQIDDEEHEENKQVLLDKLAIHNIEITNITAVVGPTVTLYELTPAAGVKVSRIKSLEDDLAMAMAARGIRMIAPIPGKTAVGVEIPNRDRELVRVRSVIGTKRFRDTNMELPVALGKTIEGKVYLQDLTKMPHLLIAGATGSGKSVGLNTLIAGLLYACHPSNLKFVMIDPKKIELQQYRDLGDHFLAQPEEGGEAIITEVADALAMLRACEREMAERYDLLQDARVRGVKKYNQLLAKGELDLSKGHKHLPYIVVIIDELADLMMTAGKEIEAPIARLAQMARAIGIHLVLATQRPSVDVITGLIKANFPSRVAFQVASKIDARTILDQNGAEQLVGNGDMLYMSGSRLLRLQGPYVSVEEVDRLMHYIGSQPSPEPYRLPAPEEDAVIADGPTGSGGNGRDELFVQAAQIVVLSQQGSVSLIQRKLSIGYTRAARIVDQLEEAGIVGAYVGAKAREVLVSDAVTLDLMLSS